MQTSVRKQGQLPETDPTVTRRTGKELLALAEELVPVLRERAAETDESRRIGDDIYEYLSSHGFFDMLKPKAYGGLELSDLDHAKVAMTLARGCASTAWVYSILDAHNRAILFYPEQAQLDVWGETPRATMAGLTNLNPKAETERVEGGFLLSGEFGFCSGSDFADWFTFVAPAGEEREAFRFLLPRADITLIDDWYPTGMRGTGSRTVKVDRAFVPDHRIIPLGGAAEGILELRKLHPTFDAIHGTWPFGGHFPFAAVAVGAAIGAIENFASAAGSLTRVKDAFGGTMKLVEQDYVAAEFAEAAAEAEMARALLEKRSHEASERSRVRVPTTPLEKAQENHAAAAAARAALRSAQRVFALVGAKAGYPSHPISIAKRDLELMSSHVTLNWRQAAVGYLQAEVAECHG